MTLFFENVPYDVNYFADEIYKSILSKFIILNPLSTTWKHDCKIIPQVSYKKHMYGFRCSVNLDGPLSCPLSAQIDPWLLQKLH